MSLNRLENRALQILSSAGIEINGAHPWDIAVHNPHFYSRVLRQGAYGLGESYVDGWWDCAQLDEFFYRIFIAGLGESSVRGWPAFWLLLKSVFSNPQTASRSARAVERHYDLGNELFQDMLDRRMVYTSGLWEGACTLDQAQEAKLDFVCRKLALDPGMKVLDIGCGWGSFAKFAAERYGVEVLGVTLSHRQVELGQKMCAGLPVELRLQDYRDVRGSFDRVVSLGMFEHVGSKNYRTFFRMARNVLRDSGWLFLSTIGSRRTIVASDAWFDRYIFPDYHLPSLSQIAAAIEGVFCIEEFQNWAAHYDRTLMAWSHNFDANWPKLRTQYGDRFYRRWKLYLQLSAGEFRSHCLQIWEILLSPICGANGSTAFWHGRHPSAVAPTPITTQATSGTQKTSASDCVAECSQVPRSPVSRKLG